MKKILVLVFATLMFNVNYSQSVNTFCYGSVSVSLISGGKAIMIRKDNTQKVVSRVTGDFDLFGKGGPTELLKINFSGTEYRYDLIRDGNGTPSVIIDNQGRRYTLCSSVGSENSGVEDSYGSRMTSQFNSSFVYQDGTNEVEKNYFILENTAISYLGSISWHSAKLATDRLKNGWHFPNANELMNIYYLNNNQKKIKFEDFSYWTSNIKKIKEGEGNFTKTYDAAYAINLKSGEGKYEAFSFEIGGTNQLNEHGLLVIKNLSIDEKNNYLKTGSILMPQSYKDSILKVKQIRDSLNLIDKLGKLFKIDKLEYSIYSINKPVSLDSLDAIVKNEFPGWRIPTLEELVFLKQNFKENNIWLHTKYPNQESNTFWTSTINPGNGQYAVFYFNSEYVDYKNTDQIFEACIVKGEISEKFKLNLQKQKEEIENQNKILSIIGSPFKIKNLEVAFRDFPEKLTWENAKEASKTLGNGWRLPTKEELKLLYKNKNLIGNLSNDFYWGFPEGSTLDLSGNSNTTLLSNGNKINVRAVRSNNSDNIEIVENSEKNENQFSSKKNELKSIKIENLEIAKNDLPGTFNWEDAKRNCEKLGDGWRLPSRGELTFLYQNRKKVGHFSDGEYWSSENGGWEQAWYLNIVNGNQYTTVTGRQLYVRPVRSL